MAEDFIAGDVAVIEASFTNSDGEPGDPTDVMLRVEAPDGEPEEIETTHPGVGSFRAEVPLPVGGTWRWRIEGSGDVETAKQGYFKVKRSLFA
jgi:hypothetical protein